METAIWKWSLPDGRLKMTVNMQPLPCSRIRAFSGRNWIHWDHLQWFEKKEVNIITGVKAMEITDQGLTITDGDGDERVIPSDTIIPTRPLVPNLELYEKLRARVPECYTIGDCLEPRKIVNAIADAYEVARNI